MSSKLKYCCQRFEVRTLSHKNDNPNIRIIKVTSNYLLNGIGGKKYINPYRFILTFGYENFNINEFSNIFFEYCPFCGADLFKFYRSDEYVHEIEGSSFIW